MIVTGPQPLRLSFENWPEDKPETPGELPDPDKGGLGGARPLGMGVAGSPVLPHPPDHPPPPPPSVTKKPSMPAPPPPPKLDQEVYIPFQFTLRNNGDQVKSKSTIFVHLHTKVQKKKETVGRFFYFFFTSVQSPGSQPCKVNGKVKV